MPFAPTPLRKETRPLRKAIDYWLLRSKAVQAGLLPRDRKRADGIDLVLSQTIAVYR